MVSAHYTGKLTDGTVFDTSRGFLRGPFKFQIGAGDVIKGWDVGVMKMSLGEKALLFIGPDYGYGAAGNGPIPPNATLKFEVELLRIERAVQRDGALHHEYDKVAKMMLGQAGHPGAA